MQACLLQFQTWVPPWVPCPLLCLWCSQWVLGIEEWCVVYQRETTPYLHHHTLTWRAAISDTFYLVSGPVLLDGNRERNFFKSHLFVSWSRQGWLFCRAVNSLSLSGVWSFTHLYYQVSVAIYVYEQNCRASSTWREPLFTPLAALVFRLTENKACLVSTQMACNLKAASFFFSPIVWSST